MQSGYEQQWVPGRLRDALLTVAHCCSPFIQAIQAPPKTGRLATMLNEPNDKSDKDIANPRVVLLLLK
jgi:hypothetical protein